MLWDPEKKTASVSRDVVFDEELMLMLQEKSKMEDKTQGGASDSSADSQSRSLSFQMTPTSMLRQMKTSQI